jgi:DmX-like protein
VFDLLSNDFSLERWKKAADKNAMVLISKKSYYLGISFFILAGKIKDAITVALGKLNDLNLAILIARLVDGYESESLFDLVDKYFIEDGKGMDDPWLVSIGYWWKKQYFDSINTFSEMIGETTARLAKKVFDKSVNFDLYKPNAVIIIHDISHENTK